MTRAARELGIGRTTFYDKLRKHNLNQSRGRCSDSRSLSGYRTDGRTDCDHNRGSAARP
ncbi:helix-turn-helix domain-containing protein [Gelria sp. Kuro-4]|uniref:helix-turn-helix domain-containing protein n=1 Tax=Gelria sp. Kuro-4 TaxID=2796927 RepID=UPI00351CBE34